MSTKISLILIALLALFVTACSPTVAKDPTPISSTNQEDIPIIPVTGENISETSNNESLSANDASNASLDEMQVHQGVCVLDAGQPSHVGGCVDFYHPNIDADKKSPSATCIPDDDLPHNHRGTCLE